MLNAEYLKRWRKLVITENEHIHYCLYIHPFDIRIDYYTDEYLKTWKYKEGDNYRLHMTKNSPTYYNNLRSAKIHIAKVIRQYIKDNLIANYSRELKTHG